MDFYKDACVCVLTEISCVSIKYYYLVCSFITIH